MTQTKQQAADALSEQAAKIIRKLSTHSLETADIGALILARDAYEAAVAADAAKPKHSECLFGEYCDKPRFEDFNYCVDHLLEAHSRGECDILDSDLKRIQQAKADAAKEPSPKYAHQPCDDCDPSFIDCWTARSPCRKKPIGWWELEEQRRIAAQPPQPEAKPVAADWMREASQAIWDDLSNRDSGYVWRPSDILGVLVKHAPAPQPAQDSRDGAITAKELIDSVKKTNHWTDELWNVGQLEMRLYRLQSERAAMSAEAKEKP